MISEASVVGWDTRARTRNNRTRICCVANYTISQFSFSNPRKSAPLPEMRCKGSAFLETDKGFGNFFFEERTFFWFYRGKAMRNAYLCGQKLKENGETDIY